MKIQLYQYSDKKLIIEAENARELEIIKKWYKQIIDKLDELDLE